MTDRLLGVVLGAAALALVGVNVAVKPAPDPTEIQDIARQVTEPQHWTGRLAPDFELRLLDGSRFRLADHVGREVVILNFFATWCGPCRDEMPELERFRDLFRGQQVVMLAIDVEEKKTAVGDFVTALHVGLPVALDESGDAARLYGVSAYPTTVVVGADGRIVHYEAGGISNAEVSLGAAVRGNLATVTAGRGIARDAYEAALAKEPKQPPSPASGDAPLTGRALRIAQSMPCPCGCDQRVSECSCQTATGIKRKLAAGGYDGKSDEEVMRELNREFCMKGM